MSHERIFAAQVRVVAVGEIERRCRRANRTQGVCRQKKPSYKTSPRSCRLRHSCDSRDRKISLRGAHAGTAVPEDDVPIEQKSAPASASTRVDRCLSPQLVKMTPQHVCRTRLGARHCVRESTAFPQNSQFARIFPDFADSRGLLAGALHGLWSVRNLPPWGPLDCCFCG